MGLGRRALAGWQRLGSHALCGMGLWRDAATRPAHGGANPATEGGVIVHGATGTATYFWGA